MGTCPGCGSHPSQFHCLGTATIARWLRLSPMSHLAHSEPGWRCYQWPCLLHSWVTSPTSVFSFSLCSLMPWHVLEHWPIRLLPEVTRAGHQGTSPGPQEAWLLTPGSAVWVPSLPTRVCYQDGSERSGSFSTLTHACSLSFLNQKSPRKDAHLHSWMEALNPIPCGLGLGSLR